MLWTIIVTLVGGTVISLLGKAVARNCMTKKFRSGSSANIACSIIGMLVGSLLYWVLFGEGNEWTEQNSKTVKATVGQHDRRHRLAAPRLAGRRRRRRRSS